MKSLAPAAIASAKPRGNHQFSPACIDIGEVSRTCVALKVFGRHRLLDPMQIVRREPGNAAAGLGRIERLVEVEHQRDVGADQGAHRLHHALVIGKIAVAALDLDAAKTLLQRAAQVLFVGDGIDRAITVIGPDRPRRPPSSSPPAYSRSGPAHPRTPCRGPTRPCRRGLASRAT